MKNQFFLQRTQTDIKNRNTIQKIIFALLFPIEKQVEKRAGKMLNLEEFFFGKTQTHGFYFRKS